MGANLFNKLIVKYPAICILLFSFAMPTKSQVYVGGEITSDATYSPANNPYIVTQDLKIPVGITLTILPGVELLFESGTALISNGTLIALGTREQKIKFSSQHRSIKTTPFFLTFGMDHNTPHFKSTPDYGEKWDTELTNRMKLVWQVTHKHLENSGEKAKIDHDKKATAHQ